MIGVLSSQSCHHDLFLLTNTLHSSLQVSLWSVVLTFSAAVVLYVRAAGSKRLSLFTSRGATQILLHVLVCESKDDECLSELLIAVHQLLAKLGIRGNHSQQQYLVSSVATQKVGGWVQHGRLL